MNTWKVILATVVIFVAGLLTGGLLVNYSHKHKQPPVARPDRPAQMAGAWSGAKLDLMRRMGSQLDLTPEQHERIDAILRGSQERTKRYFEEISPKMREEMNRVREEIRTVLTPEQIGRFEELSRQRAPRMPEDMHDRRPRDPRRPPGGPPRELGRTNSDLFPTPPFPPSGPLEPSGPRP